MKRFRKVFCSLLLAAATIVTGAATFSPATVLAATTDALSSSVWYLGGETVGSFTVTNDNLTPIKTMGDSGKLFVWTEYSRADSYSPIVVTAQIRDYDTGEILDSVQYYEGQSENDRTLCCDVTEGQRIQIYWDISSQYDSPGVYRKADITYGYVLYQTETPPEGGGTD